MSSCSHENIIHFIACYKKSPGIWVRESKYSAAVDSFILPLCLSSSSLPTPLEQLVMELCLGSICDVMDIFKAPLQERQVAAVTRDVLKVRGRIDYHEFEQAAFKRSTPFYLSLPLSNEGPRLFAPALFYPP